jgi:hypothetical protein
MNWILSHHSPFTKAATEAQIHSQKPARFPYNRAHLQAPVGSYGIIYIQKSDKNECKPWPRRCLIKLHEESTEFSADTESNGNCRLPWAARLRIPKLSSLTVAKG